MANKRHAKLKACPPMLRLGVLPRVLPQVVQRVVLRQGAQLSLFPPRRVLLLHGAEVALLLGVEAAGAPEVEAVSSLGVGALARAPRNPPQAHHRLQRVPVGRLALHLPPQRQPRPKRAQHPLRKVQVGTSGPVSHMTLKNPFQRWKQPMQVIMMHSSVRTLGALCPHSLWSCHLLSGRFTDAISRPRRLAGECVPGS